MLRLIAILVITHLLASCDINSAAVNKKLLNSDRQLQEWQKLQPAIDSLQLQLPSLLKQLKFNERVVLIAHLGIHSGLPRLVLWNVTSGQIMDSGCVAHGYGNESFSENALFSNAPNSYCSSKGKYRIGNKYKGRFGWSYKLHGLDKSNSHAFERFIVLHAYSCVPDNIIYPDYCCNSQGCAMISYAYLARLSKIIDASRRPILLWIIE